MYEDIFPFCLGASCGVEGEGRSPYSWGRVGVLVVVGIIPECVFLSQALELLLGNYMHIIIHGLNFVDQTVRKLSAVKSDCLEVMRAATERQYRRTTALMRAVSIA